VPSLHHVNWDMACTRFRRHRVRCSNGDGGGSSSDESSREFKLEAALLIKDRGVSCSGVGRLGVHAPQLRDWVKKLSDDPEHAFPGNGRMKPEQLEITRLKREERVRVVISGNNIARSPSHSASVRSAFASAVRALPGLKPNG
jgi:transposase-like protein